MIIDLRLRPSFKSFRNRNVFGRRDPDPDLMTAPGVWLDISPFRSFEDRYLPPTQGTAPPLSLDARSSLRASGER